VAAISGLSHLEGESVTILADGAVHPAKTVASGAITLDYKATKVVAGLPFTHTYRSLKWDSGNPQGTAQGQIKRIKGVTLVLLESQIAHVGPTTANLIEVPFRTVSDAMNAAVPMFTGEKYVPFQGDHEIDSRVVIQSAAPAPFTLLAVAPDIQTNPR